MRAARAERLARRACRRRPDGTAVWWSRRSWERILAAVEANDRNALRALRDAWLRDPRDDMWERMDTVLMLSDVLAAAADPSRGEANRAALIALCAGPHLIPDDPAERAAFYVLTGRPEQQEAMDPDGSLLGSAYRAATDDTRKALRLAMIECGGLDAVRIVSDRPDRALTAEEADYATRQLAEAGEWDRLWRMFPTIPPASAVRVAHQFRGWRPADAPGCAFLDRLARTDPDLLPGLAAAGVTWIEAPLDRDIPILDPDMAIAPDNSEIAITHKLGTDVFALPGGQRIAHHSGIQVVGYLLALGGATVVQLGAGNGDRRLLRSSPGLVTEVLLPQAIDTQVRLSRDGFVVEQRGDLFSGGAGGPLTRLAGAPRCTLLATDPDSGNLALRLSGPSHEIVLVDADLEVLARTHSAHSHRAVFLDPGSILLQHRDFAPPELWRRDGDSLVRTAVAESSHFSCQRTRTPDRQLVACADHSETRWLDANMLTPVERPSEFPTGKRLMFSPDGSLSARWAPAALEVRDAWSIRLAELAGRPLSRASVADLQVLDGSAWPRRAPRIQAAVEVLRAGLEYRFGAEVALGGGGMRAGGEDIALGGR